MRVVISANSKGIEEVKLSIKDEQTTNGTKVNNTKLARSGVWMPIHKGDQLKLGKTLLKVNVQQNLWRAFFMPVEVPFVAADAKSVWNIETECNVAIMLGVYEFDASK